MSGGSYNYIYSELFRECEGRMHDDEMEDLVSDLCKVLHDLEWWQSHDTSEDTYRETVAKFKAKWFKCDRSARLKGYIDAEMKKSISEQIEEIKSDMCDNYCKYPNMENDNEDWLFEDGSPCETCPLNRL